MESIKRDVNEAQTNFIKKEAAAAGAVSKQFQTSFSSFVYFVLYLFLFQHFPAFAAVYTNCLL